MVSHFAEAVDGFAERWRVGAAGAAGGASYDNPINASPAASVRTAAAASAVAGSAAASSMAARAGPTRVLTESTRARCWRW